MPKGLDSMISCSTKIDLDVSDQESMVSFLEGYNNENKIK